MLIGVRKSRCFLLSDDYLAAFFIENLGATRKQCPHVSSWELPQPAAHPFLFFSSWFKGGGVLSHTWSFQLCNRCHFFSPTPGLASCHLHLSLLCYCCYYYYHHHHYYLLSTGSHQLDYNHTEIIFLLKMLSLIPLSPSGRPHFSSFLLAWLKNSSSFFITSLCPIFLDNTPIRLFIQTIPPNYSCQAGNDTVWENLTITLPLCPHLMQCLSILTSLITSMKLFLYWFREYHTHLVFLLFTDSLFLVSSVGFSLFWLCNIMAQSLKLFSSPLYLLPQGLHQVLWL